MVRGIEKFKEYFTGFEENYIIIGGTACDIFEERAGQQLRVTKDNEKEYTQTQERYFQTGHDAK